MDFSFTRADEEFRMQVRHFFETEYPQDLIEKMAHGHSPSKADYQRSERALDSKGWVAANWPKQAGGTGWSSKQKYIYSEEIERVGAPNVVPLGLPYGSPAIYTSGPAGSDSAAIPGNPYRTPLLSQSNCDRHSVTDD